MKCTSSKSIFALQNPGLSGRQLMQESDGKKKLMDIALVHSKSCFQILILTLKKHLSVCLNVCHQKTQVNVVRRSDLKTTKKIDFLIWKICMSSILIIYKCSSWHEVYALNKL